MKQTINSLRLSLKRERSPDKRIFLLLSLAEVLSYSHIDQAVDSALQSIEEATRTGLKGLIPECELMAGRIFKKKGGLSGRANIYLRKALKTFRKIGNKDAAFDAEGELCAVNVENGNGRIAMLPLHRLLHMRTKDLEST